MMPQYPGGKNLAGTYQRIINLIPPHRVYVEPFLGSGAIMRMKRPADLNIGSDLDAAAIATHGVQISPGALIYIGPDPAAVLCRPDLYGPYPSYRFFNLDAVHLLRIYPWRGDEFVYLDPPYVRSTRRVRGALYRFEMTDEAHRELLDIVAGLPCSIAISGYASELYNDMLSGWRTYQFDAITRGGQMATEYVWMNYADNGKRHDYQYLGENFRERERIARKKKRFIKKLERMDTLERAAMLWALQESGL